MCEARRPCFLTFAPCSSPGCPGGTTKAAWPREPSSGSTEATTTWTLAMPPLVAQAFWPLSTHSSGRPRRTWRAVRIARDVGAGVGLGGAEGGDRGLVGGAEALRDPLADLLGRALAEDRGDGERGAEDRHADAGVAPEQLLVDDRHASGRSGRRRTARCPRSRRGRSSRPPGSTGHGVSSRSSHSDAAGRMTFSAKPCTQSRRSFCSSVSARLKVGSAAARGGLGGAHAARRS